MEVGGRYILVDEIGVGGMGRVFRARHAKLGKVFALKVIAPTFADDRVARARFIEEAHLASQISHPGIAQVSDFGEDPAVGAYMVMELVEGERLGKGALSVRKTLDVIAQVADVLEHIHHHGIVHGDVKLENIIVVNDIEGARRRHTVKLLDFGLAERMGARPEVLSGTPQYMAPERIQGEPPTVASDIYALGVLAYRLLTGRFPFDGELDAVLRAHLVTDPPPLGDGFDPCLDKLVRRALSKHPDERHRTASAFRYELNAVMDMLAMTRRKRSPTGDLRRAALIATLFQETIFPQAIVDADGAIQLANDAFTKLYNVGEGDPVAAVIIESVRQALQSQRALERRFADVHVWCAPFARQAVHVLIRRRAARS